MSTTQPTSKAPAAPGGTGTPTTPPPGKTLRRNLLSMYSRYGTGDPFWEDSAKELDRYMIALYQFQRNDKILYRQLCGVHNGGWLSKDAVVDGVMKKKATLDSAQDYPAWIIDPTAAPQHPHEAPAQPSAVTWPDPEPNTPDPDFLYFTATPDNAENWWRAHEFCWHAKSPFFIWHRPFMIMFERLLQKNDPLQKGHVGSQALGAHYFKWEDWDGTSCHPLFFRPTYEIRSNAFKGYKLGNITLDKGTSIENPLFRWFAPPNMDMQANEVFPDTLNDRNCTSRDPAYFNPALDFSFPWQIVDQVAQDGHVISPSMQRNVSGAYDEPNWQLALTVEFAGYRSFENSHNKFHNHIGGQGHDGRNVYGTMTSNQSPFDPIFWVHHSNVERQLLSWQRRHLGRPEGPLPQSLPDAQHRALVMYPWVKPSEFAVQQADGKLQFGLSVDPSPQHDGTFGEWFDTWNSLPYDYDEHLDSIIIGPRTPIRDGVTVGNPRELVVHAHVPTKKMKRGGAEYTLFYKPPNVSDAGARNVLPVSNISIISGGAEGAFCARCAKKPRFAISFNVTGFTCGGVAVFEEAYVDPKKWDDVVKQLTVSYFNVKTDSISFSLAACHHLSVSRGAIANKPAQPLAGEASPCCVGKGHSIPSVHASKKLVIAQRNFTPELWNAITQSKEIEAIKKSIAEKEKLELQFVPLPAATGGKDEAAAGVNCYVVATPIDGPAKYPVGFTSHYKGNKAPNFANVSFTPPIPEKVRDAVILYVDLKVTQAHQGLTPKVVSHLLQHAVGRDHTHSEAAPVFN